MTEQDAAQKEIELKSAQLSAHMPTTTATASKQFVLLLGFDFLRN